MSECFCSEVMRTDPDHKAWHEGHLRFEREIWFCQMCGSTFDRSERDPVFACGYCTNGRMIPATISWTELTPDPDPLISLLIGSE